MVIIYNLYNCKTVPRLPEQTCECRISKPNLHPKTEVFRWSFIPGILLLWEGSGPKAEDAQLGVRGAAAVFLRGNMEVLADRVPVQEGFLAQLWLEAVFPVGEALAAAGLSLGQLCFCLTLALLVRTLCLGVLCPV